MIENVFTPVEIELGARQLRSAGGFLHFAEQVSAEIEAKAERRMAAGRKAATEVARFYDEHVMRLRKFDYDLIFAGPELPFEFCRAMDELIAAGVAFSEWWRPFCAERGIHVAEAVMKGMDEYLEWLSGQQAAMQPYLDRFVHDPRVTGLWGPRYGGLRSAAYRQAEEKALRDHLASDAGRETLGRLDAATARKPVPLV